MSKRRVEDGNWLITPEYRWSRCGASEQEQAKKKMRVGVGKQKEWKMENLGRRPWLAEDLDFWNLELKPGPRPKAKGANTTPDNS